MQIPLGIRGADFAIDRLVPAAKVHLVEPAFDGRLVFRGQGPQHRWQCCRRRAIDGQAKEIPRRAIGV